MREILKLYQTRLSIAILILTLFLGVGLPMIIPSTPYNGILIIIIGSAISIFLFIWAYKSYKRQRSIPQPLKEVIELDLIDTLTAMHRRLMELQKEKSSHSKVSRSQLKKVLPTLADRMGTVKREDWPKFVRDLEKRIRRASPRRPHISFKRPLSFKRWAKWKEEARFAALSVAKEAHKELLQSEEWTFEDGIKISKWLDGYDWGVQKLRDNDLQWKGLYESIDNYLIDDVLRDSIKKHIDLSHIYNNVCLIVHYSGKFKGDVFSVMLYEALIGSPISPEEVDMGLSEILCDIEKRLEEMNNE